jgi:cell wall assembly regulator SMI1
MVEELIVRLDRWLSENRPDYYARLQPGVTKEVFRDFEAEIGMELPASFRQLYRWRNGQDPAYSASLWENWMFSPLEDVLHFKRLLDGMIGSDFFEDPSWWRRGWVPFLYNGGGDHLCLDLTAEGGGTAGQLITFWHDWDRRVARFASVESWLKALVESMENGTIELNRAVRQRDYEILHPRTSRPVPLRR